jgi:hypothetical protein
MESSTHAISDSTGPQTAETGRAPKPRIFSSVSWTTVLVLVTLALGVTQTIVTRRSMNPDGMSYLDLGRYIVRGDPAGVSGYWSPLYPLLQGVVLRLLHPSIRWEIPLVHATNFAIYVFVFLAFQFCWRRLKQYRAQPNSEGYAGLDSWMLLGFALFWWASLGLVTLELVSPDLCLVGIVFVAAALLDSIRHQRSWQQYALLGLVLGVGYLLKAIFFPLGFVFLAVSLFCAGNVRKALPGALLGLIIFLAVCAPWIVLVSKQKRYLTYGVTGKLNYIWFDNLTRPWITGVHYTGSGMAHPPQVISEDPVVYAYPAPANGSYPFWFDPSYWSEGLTVHFDAARQTRMLKFNLSAQLFQLSPEQYLFVAFLLMFLFLGPRTFERNLLKEWHLWVPGLCGLLLYLLVHVESRLTAPFLVLIFAAAFAAAARDRSQSGRLHSAVALSLALLFAAFVLVRSGPSYASRSPNDNEAVANRLRQEGLRPGDRIGLIGDAYRAYWLHLARVSVAAEINPTQAGRFWTIDPDRRAAVMRALAQNGAKAVVSDQPPPSDTPGWRRLGNTKAFIYFLDPALPQQ